jgi:hypothetical protein
MSGCPIQAIPLSCSVSSSGAVDVGCLNNGSSIHASPESNEQRMRAVVDQTMMSTQRHGIAHPMIRIALGLSSALLLGGVNPITASSVGKAMAAEPWVSCLYNNKSIPCRRTFLCADAPCDRFKLEWKDGLHDTYTRVKDGAARNVGFYKDQRGGEWMLRGYAGSFGMINQANDNTIIVGMSLEECRTSGLSDLCAAIPNQASADPQQALAILLKQLDAKPLGLYDGVRLLRINTQGSGSLTMTVSCEREQWRVQSSDNSQGRPSFYDAPFLAAPGISRTWVCTGPARVLE